MFLWMCVGEGERESYSFDMYVLIDYVSLLTDIYVCMVSSTHNVCPQNYYLAIVATTVETNNPEAELQPGLDLLGAIEEK